MDPCRYMHAMQEVQAGLHRLMAVYLAAREYLADPTAPRLAALAAVVDAAEGIGQ